MLDFGDELGGEDVDLLVGAVQQAQCPDLVGGGRVVSGGFGFLAAVSGLEGCDFGGLREQKICVSKNVLLCLCGTFMRSFRSASCGLWARTSFLWCRHS